ncbi:MAG: hypothetical protein M1823_006596, partial [Watsoniomyces obsoletus]
MLPLAAELWQARTASEWKRLYLTKIAGRESGIPSLHNCLDDIGCLNGYQQLLDLPFVALIISSAQWSLCLAHRELVRLQGNRPSRNVSLALSSMHEETSQTVAHTRLSFTVMSGGLQPPAQVMFERAQMSLYVNLEDVQTLAGKAGEEEARKIHPVLTNWAQSSESRKAIWHAGQLYRAAKEYPRVMLQDFAAVALYH